MVELYGRSWTRAELLSYLADMDQVGGIRSFAYQDGPEAGVRALEFRTGAGLNFTVLADRSMDIAMAEINATPVSFLTPVGYVHPAYFEEPGLNWLRTFQGGLFVTCGLDTTGFPSNDGGQDFGLHGRGSTLAARNLSFDADWKGDEYVLRARGKMRQASFHGEHLQLTREITARLGRNTIWIHDTVENMGTRREPHAIMYHFNAGFPLLDDGAELMVRSQGIQVVTDNAHPALPTCRQVHEPRFGFAEEVFIHDTIPGADGTVSATLVNRAFRGGRGLAMAIRYRKAELPFLIQWRNFKERAYVMGIEPANADVRGRAYNRAQGTLVELDPGERREYHLEVEIADDPAGVARLTAS